MRHPEFYILQWLILIRNLLQQDISFQQFRIIAHFQYSCLSVCYLNGIFVCIQFVSFWSGYFHDVICSNFQLFKHIAVTAGISSQITSHIALGIPDLIHGIFKREEL